MTPTILGLSVLLICAPTLAQDPPSPSRGEFPENWVVDAIISAELGEKRPYAVVLPESYREDSTRRYPVFYVLDGGHVKHTSATAAALAREGVMPEIIAVGIPNTSRNNRERDLTPPFLQRDIAQPGSPRGQGDRFLAFLKTELIPTIERDFRTTSVRALIGNSRGGLLVFYSLMAEPDLFHARFAFSTPAWRTDAITLHKLRDALQSQRFDSTFFYMAVGSDENANILSAYHKAVSILQDHAPKNLRWQATMTPGAKHQNNAELATKNAFTALYEKWQSHH